jgi:enoyl-CoA hydratase
MNVQYRIENSLGTITLDNPPYNTLTHPVFTSVAGLRDFLETPDLKGIIVKGSGRNFCGGADLNFLQKLRQEPENVAAMLDEGKNLLTIIEEASLPVVAVIRGSCLGAGLEIALACHFRFASPGALLGFPEAVHGVMPGFGGTLRSSPVMLKSNIIDLMLSGRIIQSEEAKQSGIIDQIWPGKEVEEAALSFLRSLTGSRSTQQIRSIMQSIHNGRTMDRSEALHQESLLFEALVRKLPVDTIRPII